MRILKVLGLIFGSFAIIGIAMSIFPNVSMKTINPIIGLVLLLVIIFFYFLPTYIAYKRKHHQKQPIAVINTFLGWTLIGWVVALAWSYSAQPSKATP